MPVGLLFKPPQLGAQGLVWPLRLMGVGGGEGACPRGRGVRGRARVIGGSGQNLPKLRLLHVHLVLLLRPLALGRRAEVGVQLWAGTHPRRSKVRHVVA